MFYKNKKGFTLIELLAIMVILSVIALISTPFILKIISNAKLTSAEDSTMGIVSAAKNYISNFIVKTDGYFPSDGISFTCNEKCMLQNSNLDEYDISSLQELDIKGTKPTGGKVDIGSDGQTIIVTDLLIGNYICNYPTKNGTASCTEKGVQSNNDKLLVEPIATISPSGYSQSKTVKIKYMGSGTYLLKPLVSAVSDITAVACTEISNIEYICNGDNVSEGGLLKAGTWYKVENSPTLTVTSNGTILFKVIGTNEYKDVGSIIVTGIDRTPPTEVGFTTNSTSNSIKVTASGKDEESGVIRYQFSNDNGKTWLPIIPQSNSSYTFNKLSSANYNIKVKIFNGTIINNEQNDLNTKESSSKVVNVSSLDKPFVAKQSPDGWSQSKNVTITYTGSGAYLFRSSVNVTSNVDATVCSSVNNGDYTCDGGKIKSGGTLVGGRWYKVDKNPTLTFTSKGTLAYKVADGMNYKDGAAINIDKIDRTAPTAATFTTSIINNNISIKANGVDNESGIIGYQFSKDDGKTWEPTNPQTTDSYVFRNITNGNYKIRVKVINGTYVNNKSNNMNTTISEMNSSEIFSLTTPVGGKSSPTGWAQSKTITITYNGQGTYLLKPSVNVKTNLAATQCFEQTETSYTCNGTSVPVGGTLIGGQWYKVQSSVTLTFETQGNVMYKVVGGGNATKIVSSTIDSIDRTPPTSASFTTGTVTKDSIKVTAIGTDGESGILKYQFSKNGGITWEPTNPQTDSKYTFSGLSSSTTYQIKVRVFNGTILNNSANSMNYKDSNVVNVTTISSDTTPPDKPTLTATLGTIVNYYNTSSITLTATSRDTGSGINRYVFYNGSTVLGTVNTSANSASITVTSLPTTNMNFKVIVYDNKENHNENSVTESCSNNGTYCVGGYNTTVYSCTSTAYSGTRQYSMQGSSCITTTTTTTQRNSGGSGSSSSGPTDCSKAQNGCETISYACGCPGQGSRVVTHCYECGRLTYMNDIGCKGC